MLSTFLNTFARHGLSIDEVVEPPPPREWLADAPGVGPVPVYFVARYRRQAT
jgi:hypothetical protein